MLSQHNDVTVVDVVPEKINKLNNHISPIKDEYIERYLKEKKLNLYATLDAEKAYIDADYVIIATQKIRPYATYAKTYAKRCSIYKHL